MTSGESSLSGQQRRLVIGVAIVMACSVAAAATYNFIVDPITLDFEATKDQKAALRQLPSIGTLLVVFLVGAWGPRFGMKRVIWISAIIMMIGYAIVLVAPVIHIVTLGMLLSSVGKQGIQVVAISLIAVRLIKDKDRATGFAVAGMAVPAVFVVLPLLANMLLDAAGWRAVVVTWVGLAAVAAIAARRLLPSDERREPAGEMWTPALAGLVLVSVIQVTRDIGYEGFVAPRTLTWLAVLVFSLLALWQLMTRLPKPTLDLSVFRRGGYKLLLIVVILLPFANLYYYFSVGAQTLYDYSAMQAAALMVPGSLAAIAGAWVARSLLRRFGLRTAGTSMLLGLTTALFLTAGQSVETPVVFPVLVLCLFALTLAGGGVVLTNAIMNFAKPGEEGSASAVKSAANAFGVAVGVTLSSAVFLVASQSTMQELVTTSGGDWSLATEMDDEFRDSTRTRDEIASEYSLPSEVVDLYDEAWLKSLAAGYEAQGLLGGCIGLLATLLFFFDRRGLRQVDNVDR